MAAFRFSMLPAIGIVAVGSEPHGSNGTPSCEQLLASLNSPGWGSMASAPPRGIRGIVLPREKLHKANPACRRSSVLWRTWRTWRTRRTWQLFLSQTGEVIERKQSDKLLDGLLLAWHVTHNGSAFRSSSRNWEGSHVSLILRHGRTRQAGMMSTSRWCSDCC